MPSSKLNAILVSSLLTTTHAFVPLSIAPLPTDLDTNLWKPVSTLPAIAAVTAAPNPTLPEVESTYDILPVDDLRKRQGAPVADPGAGAAPQVTQVSPITTYLIQSGANQVPVVYTQTFDPIPDQWPGPIAGTIGMGTIQGEIGVIRTKVKREMPTQAPMGGQTLEWKGRIPAKEEWPELGKEGKKQAENPKVIPLEDKEKKPPIEDETTILEKETKKEPVSASDDPVPLEMEGKKEPTLKKTIELLEMQIRKALQGSTTSQSGETGEVSSSAHVLKAGTLAVIAVSVGTICLNYL